uniref:CCHC-type domain-containing protein n=1 Tax=Lactuca sativa TaxID=4236 RepID=A0A9R1WNA4_LACSA|nr:hypothetical protein LSAT_V11C100029810 [Lactuca sativa]
MVTPEDKYIWGLASAVQGLVIASRPSTFNSAKQLANQLEVPKGKCNFHHLGNYREVIYNKCNMRGQISRYYRRTPNTTAQGSRNCFKCNQPGNFRKDCPQLKNQGGNGRALMITTGDALPELLIVIGTFHINNV